MRDISALNWSYMKPSFGKRVKRAVQLEFHRIREEHRHTGVKRRRPSLSVMFNYWLQSRQNKVTHHRHRRSSGWRIPLLTKKANHYIRSEVEKYKVVFSFKYLIITLNSTLLYLASFFLIHFLTHLVTGITAWFCEISTTLNYTFVDFHIRYWNWTEEMVIVVFSAPAIFTLIIALIASRAFTDHRKRIGILKRLRLLTKKQRQRHRQKQRRIQRQSDLEQHAQRITSDIQQPVKKRHRTRLSWPTRLFLLWTLYHSTTYFFSGMLYSFLFHRRFGYVIWYAFNSYVFDVLFSVVAFLSMVIIGYVFSVQFFYSARMYLNDLNGKNRMPFVMSQAIFPFCIGTILTILFQIPKFDPALILLNFSLFFLLLPLPSRAARFENIHFDSREKPPRIFWKWVIWSAVIVLSILIAIKIGITIKLP